jgi:peptidoglycan/LPS O-acetylase OafA/YrhL
MMGQTVQSRASPDRRPYLDAYRALACLLVFFYHSALNLQAGKIVFFGYNGVHLFFVLSGYLLGGRLLERLSVGDKSWTIFVYLRHRFLRIYPAYFVCLCIFVLLRYLSDTSAPTMWDFLSRVGLYFNYLDMTDLFAIHAALWTLAVEIQFYLFLPVASLLVLWLMKEWKAATVVLGMLLVVIGLVSRSYEVLFVNHWWPSVSIVRFKWVFSYLDLFGIGILLYSAERAARFAIRELKLFVAVLSVFVALVILSAISIWAKRSGVDWQNAHDPLFMIVAPLFTCIAFAMILGSTGLSRLKDLPVFHWKWLQWIGEISYSVYLYHVGVLFAVNRLLDPLGRGVDWTTSCIIIASVSLPITLAIAWLSYVFVEVPFIQGHPLPEYSRIFGRFLPPKRSS